jgi:hypothetical protein
MSLLIGDYILDAYLSSFSHYGKAGLDNKFYTPVLLLEYEYHYRLWWLKPPLQSDRIGAWTPLYRLFGNGYKVNGFKATCHHGWLWGLR